MGWVKDALKELEAGRQAKIRPVGGSMRGRIESGQLVTIAPIDPIEAQVDDVVFVEWRGNYLLHLIKETRDGQYLIGNNVGNVNGWVAASAIKARVVEVDD